MDCPLTFVSESRLSSFVVDLRAALSDYVRRPRVSSMRARYGSGAFA